MEKQTTPTPRLTEELKRMLPSRSALVAWVVLASILVGFSWQSLLHLVATWRGQEDYQHGFFVPLFAMFLLWARRDKFPTSVDRGSAWGLVFFGLWALIRWVAIYFNYGTLPELSLVPFFAGVALFVGGWQGLRWAWPSVVFLFFMIPLPGVAQAMFSEQLQSLATRVSVFIIQTFGIPSVAQGNVIQLTGQPLEVAKACSGLRMMMLFFAICIGAAFLTKRPLWEKLVIIVSAAPIAVISNVARIVVTAVAFEVAMRWPSLINLETQSETIHNWAGYLMMPFGLLLLWLETALLSSLLIESADRPLVLGTMLADEKAKGWRSRDSRKEPVEG
jgi:exosortase